MYARRATAPQSTRTARLAQFPAPVAGLIANRSLAQPRGQGLPPGAAVLENWFPTATGIVLRRGKAQHSDTESAETITSMWSYVAGSTEQMFAAAADGIWNVTSTASEVYSDVTSGDWIVTQFATSGGIYLIGVNGTDNGFVYDGTDYWPYLDGGVLSLNYSSEVTPFTAGETVTGGTSGATGTIFKVEASTLYLTGVTGTFQAAETITSAGGEATADGAQTAHIPGLTGIATSSLSYVWAYKQRLYFIEKNSLNAWYLPVDQIGGTATEFPLGGVFNLGGTLVWGQTWSGDSSGDGGLSEQMVLVSSEGEVAAYQGLNPSDSSTWGKVGNYRIGKPLGKRAFIRAGGDLVIATTVGFVSLAEASRRDLAALGSVAVSYPIEDEWREAVATRGDDGWNCEVWPSGQMVLVVPPLGLQSQVVFVANSNTGAWAKFTGWPVACLKQFMGSLYFGTSAGIVTQAWTTGSDDGESYVGKYMPLFDDFGGVSARKIAKMARIMYRSRFTNSPSVAAKFEYDKSFPVPPSGGVPDENSSRWGTALWGTATWGTSIGALQVFNKRFSVGGSGDKMSIAVQFTSGDESPSDVEIIEADISYTTGDILT